MNIAFIGTGIMGSRMAARLIAAGHRLTVHNRTRDKAADLIAAGALWADTPRAAVQDAALVITMLAHPEAVESAALGDGFLDALPADTVWIDSSTVNPAFARRMAAAAAARGVHFLDAPVAGSKGAAQDGQLVFYAGGDAAVVARVHDLLMTMGRLVIHVGETGQGIALKLVGNHLLATSMLAIAEGIAFGEAMGLPREMVLNTIAGGATAPPYFAGKRPKIESGEYAADFPLRWLHKDLHMVAEAAYEAGATMTLTNAAKELYQLAVRHGYGDDDFSAVYAFLRRSSE